MACIVSADSVAGLLLNALSSDPQKRGSATESINAFASDADPNYFLALLAIFCDLSMQANLRSQAAFQVKNFVKVADLSLKALHVKAWASFSQSRRMEAIQSLCNVLQGPQAAGDSVLQSLPYVLSTVLELELSQQSQSAAFLIETMCQAFYSARNAAAFSQAECILQSFIFLHEDALPYVARNIKGSLIDDVTTETLAQYMGTPASPALAANIDLLRSVLRLYVLRVPYVTADEAHLLALTSLVNHLLQMDLAVFLDAFESICLALTEVLRTRHALLLAQVPNFAAPTASVSMLEYMMGLTHNLCAYYMGLASKARCPALVAVLGFWDVAVDILLPVYAAAARDSVGGSSGAIVRTAVTSAQLLARLANSSPIDHETSRGVIQRLIVDVLLPILYTPELPTLEDHWDESGKARDAALAVCTRLFEVAADFTVASGFAQPCYAEVFNILVDALRGRGVLAPDVPGAQGAPGSVAFDYAAQLTRLRDLRGSASAAPAAPAAPTDERATVELGLFREMTSMAVLTTVINERLQRLMEDGPTAALIHGQVVEVLQTLTAKASSLLAFTSSPQASAAATLAAGTEPFRAVIPPRLLAAASDALVRIARCIPRTVADFVGHFFDACVMPMLNNTVESGALMVSGIQVIALLSSDTQRSPVTAHARGYIFGVYENSLRIVSSLSGDDTGGGAAIINEILVTLSQFSVDLLNSLVLYSCNDDLQRLMRFVLDALRAVVPGLLCSAEPSFMSISLAETLLTVESYLLDSFQLCEEHCFPRELIRELIWFVFGVFAAAYRRDGLETLVAACCDVIIETQYLDVAGDLWDLFLAFLSPGASAAQPGMPGMLGGPGGPGAADYPTLTAICGAVLDNPEHAELHHKFINVLATVLPLVHRLDQDQGAAGPSSRVGGICELVKHMYNRMSTSLTKGAILSLFNDATNADIPLGLEKQETLGFLRGASELCISALRVDRYGAEYVDPHTAQLAKAVVKLADSYMYQASTRGPAHGYGGRYLMSDTEFEGAVNGAVEVVVRTYTYRDARCDMNLTEVFDASFMAILLAMMTDLIRFVSCARNYICRGHIYSFLQNISVQLGDNPDQKIRAIVEQFVDEFQRIVSQQ